MAYVENVYKAEPGELGGGIQELEILYLLILAFNSCVVRQKRSVWRLSVISDFFWAIVNFIGVFFMTMFSMDKSNEYKKGSGAGKKWDGGPGGGPGGGPYGGNGGGGRFRGPRTLADLRSNDHSSLPACGSCCG